MPEFNAGARSILLVDRDPDNRRIVRAVLEHYGYHVVETPSADTALELLRAGPPSLVISELYVSGSAGDCHMPRSIREIPTLGDCRVLVLTTAVYEPEVRRSRVPGADAVITKPYHPRDLVDFVERLIGPPRPDSPGAAASDARRGDADRSAEQRPER